MSEHGRDGPGRGVEARTGDASRPAFLPPLSSGTPGGERYSVGGGSAGDLPAPVSGGGAPPVRPPPGWSSPGWSSSSRPSRPGADTRRWGGAALAGGIAMLVVAVTVLTGVLVVHVAASGGSGNSAAGHPRARGALPQASPQATRPPAHPRELPGYHGKPAKRTGRIVDGAAHLSYVRLGRPWHRSLALDPGFTAGESFDTQPGVWSADITSGRSPESLLTQFTGPHLAFRAAEAMADQLAATNYTHPYTRTEVASQPLRVGSHKGWLVAARLHFHKRNLRATSELMVVAAVDTGRRERTPSLLYMSIPNTASKRLPDVTRVLHSLRVVS